MALVEMKKVELALHRSVTEKVVASLQRLECCEIIGYSGDNASGETKGGPVSEHLKRYENLLSDARFALRFLENYRQGKVSFLAKALSEKPHRNMVELESLSDETDFQNLVAQLRGLERQFVEIRTEMSQLAGLEAILGNFKDLSQPLLFFHDRNRKSKRCNRNDAG